MTDIQASLGMHQLRRLDNFISTRREYADRYAQAFANLPELQIPDQDRDCTYHLYVVRLNLNRLSINRAQFIAELKDHNIGSSVHFIPVHLHRYYQERFGYQRGTMPVAEKLCDQIVSLPLCPAMSIVDISDVISTVEQVVAANRK
jgi:dTDP-4-amino-4,6-dideoxygalactose transaminase